VSALSADQAVSQAERDVATAHLRALDELASNPNRDVLVIEAFGKRAIDETLQSIPELERSLYLNMPQYQRAQAVAADINNVNLFVAAPDGTRIGNAEVNPETRRRAVERLILKHGQAAVPLDLKLAVVRPPQVTAPQVTIPQVMPPMTDQERAGDFFAD
jgi:hypothetical protein